MDRIMIADVVFIEKTDRKKSIIEFLLDNDISFDYDSKEKELSIITEASKIILDKISKDRVVAVFFDRTKETKISIKTVEKHSMEKTKRNGIITSMNTEKPPF